jgi:hypothetical protein
MYVLAAAARLRHDIVTPIPGLLSALSMWQSGNAVPFPSAAAISSHS